MIVGRHPGISRRRKLANLRRIVREMGSTVIGYSGGADSALLAYVAHDELGDKAVAVMALSESYPRREQVEARQFASDLGIPVVMVETQELHNESYASNPTNRCYFCKLELFTHLARICARTRYILDCLWREP